MPLEASKFTGASAETFVPSTSVPPLPILKAPASALAPSPSISKMPPFSTVMLPPAAFTNAVVDTSVPLPETVRSPPRSTVMAG